jgi:hypothetical protein
MDSSIPQSPTQVLAPTLDRFTALDWSNGVQVPHLLPHDRLIVRTLNSTYEIVVLVPHTASVMVRGGQFFPDFAPAFLAGSSLGGGFLKLHGVYVGLRMEFATDDLPIITTHVKTLSVHPARDGQVM